MMFWTRLRVSEFKVYIASWQVEPNRMRQMNQDEATAFGYLYCAVYTLGQVVAAFVTIAGGEGTVLLTLPLVTWPLILIAAVQLPKLDKAIRRRAFLWTVFSHYLLTAIFVVWVFVAWDESFNAGRYIAQNPFVFITGLVWYVGGQIFLWVAYFVQTRSENTDSLP